MENIFYLIGPLLFAVGIWSFYRQMKFFKTSMVIQGTIIDIRERPASKNKTAYYPVMKYLNPVSSIEEIYESSSPYEPTKYKVGDTVELRHLAEGTHKKICINNWSGIWGLSFMLVLFGVIFAAFSVAMLVLKK